MNTLQLLNSNRDLLLEVVVDLNQQSDGTISMRPVFPFMLPPGCAYALLCTDGKPIGQGTVDPAYDPFTEALEAQLGRMTDHVVDRLNNSTLSLPGVSGTTAGVAATLEPGQQ